MATETLAPNTEALNPAGAESLLPQIDRPGFNTEGILRYAERYAQLERLYNNKGQGALSAKFHEQERAQAELNLTRQEADIGLCLHEVIANAEGLAGTEPVLNYRDRFGNSPPEQSMFTEQNRQRAVTNLSDSVRNLWEAVAYNAQDPGLGEQESMTQARKAINEGQHRETVMSLLVSMLERRQHRLNATRVNTREANERMRLKHELGEMRSSDQKYDQRMAELGGDVGHVYGGRRRSVINALTFLGVGQKPETVLPHEVKGRVRREIRMMGRKLPPKPDKNRSAETQALEAEIDKRAGFITDDEQLALLRSLAGLGLVVDKLSGGWTPRVKDNKQPPLSHDALDRLPRGNFRQERRQALDTMRDHHTYINKYLRRLWAKGLRPDIDKTAKVRAEHLDEWRYLIDSIPEGDSSRTSQITAYHRALFRLEQAEILSDRPTANSFHKHERLGIGIVHHDNDVNPIEIFWPGGQRSNEPTEDGQWLNIKEANGYPWEPNDMTPTLVEPLKMRGLRESELDANLHRQETAWQSWEGTRTPESLKSAWEAGELLQDSLGDRFSTVEESIAATEDSISALEAERQELRELTGESGETGRIELRKRAVRAAEAKLARLKFRSKAYAGQDKPYMVNTAKTRVRLSLLKRRLAADLRRQQELEAANLDDSITNLRERLANTESVRRGIVSRAIALAEKQAFLEAHHTGRFEREVVPGTVPRLGDEALRGAGFAPAGYAKIFPRGRVIGRVSQRQRGATMDESGQVIHASNRTVLTKDGPIEGSVTFGRNGLLVYGPKQSRNYDRNGRRL